MSDLSLEQRVELLEAEMERVRNMAKELLDIGEKLKRTQSSMEIFLAEQSEIG